MEHTTEYLAVAYALVNLLNKITAHWSSATGIRKWVLLVVEALSVLPSKGERGVKIPGVIK